VPKRNDGDLQKYLAAKNRASKASAKVDLIEAKLRVAGKEIHRDYRGDGPPKISIRPAQGAESSPAVPSRTAPKKGKARRGK
jgi:hypothetical protein